MPDQGSCTVIVGCQWGDEGKGKIVDVLAEQVDIVARYQGGANAGHTVHVGDDQFVLHQIPSGVLHAGRRCLLGNGVVLDVQQFFEEYDALLERGIDIEGRVGVSYRAQLLMPYHRFLDKAVELAADTKIGTTGRGIGPAYEDKAGRRGVRVADLLSPDRLNKRISAAKTRVETRLEELGAGTAELNEAMERTLALSERLLAIATDVGPEISGALRSGRNVLLEGAQGTALDLDHGTYPFVTSSNTTAGSAATGSGIGPTQITDVIGIVKAYTTRVGEGPLPSSMAPQMDEHVRMLGGEFGAATGRRRPRNSWSEPPPGRPPEIPRENEYCRVRLRKHTTRHSLGDAARVRPRAGRGLLRHHGRLYDTCESLLSVDGAGVDAIVVDDHYFDPGPVRLFTAEARPPVRPDE